MCGFYGRVQAKQKEYSVAQARNRIERLHHRGPDETGFWENDNLLLAHKRLSMLDFDKSKQPMVSAKGNVLVYNGEIYNNLEMRAQLTVYGYSFATVGDTELVLAAYEMWGEEAWKRFNGMFAFALYDTHKEELYLVRDRFGLKPLFYQNTDETLEFASEPVALYNGNVPLQYNESGLINFLRIAHNGSTAGSLVENINSLEPGAQLKLSKELQTISKWWSPQMELTENNSNDKAQIRFNIRYLLEQAVSRQVIADAPVGVFLSGGIDSALITALYRQSNPNTIHTFTVALEGDVEELEFARTIAEQWQTVHHERMVSISEFFSAMRKLIKIRNLPLSLPNEVMIYLLSQTAKQEVKAVLSGEGADELFGGYSFLLSKMTAYQKAAEPALAGESFYRQTLQKEFPHETFQNSKAFFLNIYSWFNKNELEECLTAAYRKHFQNANDLMMNTLPLGSFNRLSEQNNIYATLEFFHLPLLLSRLDGSAMAASLEGRLPFTDNDLVNYVTGLPAELKFSTGTKSKKLLREAFEDLLPKKTLNRPKKAFHIPLETLFSSEIGQSELKKMFTNKNINSIFDMQKLQALLNSNTAEDRNMKLWLLLSLSMWMESNTM